MCAKHYSWHILIHLITNKLMKLVLFHFYDKEMKQEKYVIHFCKVCVQILTQNTLENELPKT